MKTRTLLTATLVALILLAPLHASGQTAEDRWTFTVAPFFWLPSIDGKLNKGPPMAGGTSPNVSMDADDLLSAFDFGFMLYGEARKGRWLIGTEVMYADFSGVKSSVRSVDFDLGHGPVNISTGRLNTGTEGSLECMVWTLVGGYNAVQVPWATLDLIGGVRYMGVKMEIDYQLTADVTGTGPLGNTVTFPRTGSVEKSEDVWTGIVGVKGRLKLGESNWFVPYYGDIGWGSSLFTWQGSGGIGYAFSWGDVRLEYRYLSYSQGDDLFKELSAGGISLGAYFVF